MTRWYPALLGAALWPVYCAADKPAEPVKTNLCEIVKQPAQFTGKLVRFRATIESGVMDLPSGAADEHCGAEVPFFSTDDRYFAELVKDREFRKLTKYLSQTPLVQATLTGRFEYREGGNGKKPEMGLILQSVAEVTAHKVK